MKWAITIDAVCEMGALTKMALNASNNIGSTCLEMCQCAQDVTECSGHCANALVCVTKIGGMKSTGSVTIDPRQLPTFHSVDSTAVVVCLCGHVATIDIHNSVGGPVQVTLEMKKSVVDGRTPPTGLLTMDCMTSYQLHLPATAGDHDMQGSVDRAMTLNAEVACIVAGVSSDLGRCRTVPTGGIVENVRLDVDCELWFEIISMTCICGHAPVYEECGSQADRWSACNVDRAQLGGCDVAVGSPDDLDVLCLDVATRSNDVSVTGATYESQWCGACALQDTQATGPDNALDVEHRTFGPMMTDLYADDHV